MLMMPTGARMFIATTPTDLRKSFDGLGAIVQSHFDLSPTSGDLFIFLNRRATQVRILVWERDGFWIHMKRLEQGTFRKLVSPDGRTHVEIEALEFAMLLEGVDAQIVRRRKRYRLPSGEAVRSEKNRRGVDDFSCPYS